MKLLIVVALLGAVFAAPADEVEPVVLGEAPAPGVDVEPVMLDDVPMPEFVDFGIAYIPESVAREVGLDGPVDEPSPVNFVDDIAEIAPGELEAVRIVDIAEFNVDPNPVDTVQVAEPDIVILPEFQPNRPGKIFENPLWR